MALQHKLDRIWLASAEEAALNLTEEAVNKYRCSGSLLTVSFIETFSQIPVELYPFSFALHIHTIRAPGKNFSVTLTASPSYLAPGYSFELAYTRLRASVGEKSITFQKHVSAPDWLISVVPSGHRLSDRLIDCGTSSLTALRE